VDTVTRTERSRIMRLVKSEGNRSTELAFLAALRHHGIGGWRRNWPLSGKPDFVFPRRRLAVFVDGCFWHGCPRHLRRPSMRRGYWRTKIDGNVSRDRRNRAALRRHGWTVMRVWEHELDSERWVIRLRRMLA
jgi:DNA mismatch endonuclease (patch repair protein)